MGTVREQATAAPNEMTSRAVEEAVAWEETGTQQGAQAALAVTGRVLAENPLSVEALHLKGVALDLLGRWVVPCGAPKTRCCLRLVGEGLSDMVVTQKQRTVIVSCSLLSTMICCCTSIAKGITQGGA